MSDKLRARAREWALDLHLRNCGADEIEAAILTGMREVLREEPDAEMIRVGGLAAFGDTTAAHLAFNAMGDCRARGLE